MLLVCQEGGGLVGWERSSPWLCVERVCVCGASVCVCVSECTCACMCVER